MEDNNETLESYSERCGWPCDLKTGKFSQMPEAWYLDYIHRHGCSIVFEEHKMVLHFSGTKYPAPYHKSGITLKNPISRQLHEYAREVCTFVYGPPPLPQQIPNIPPLDPVTSVQLAFYAPVICPGCGRRIPMPPNGRCPHCDAQVWRFRATGDDNVR